MGQRREPGQILQNTYLVDANCFRIKRLTALYVVKGQQTALIDSGTRGGAPAVIEALKMLGLFPVDKIILTHEHSDHTQGAVPLVQAMGGNVPVFASRKAKAAIECPSGSGYSFGGDAIDPVPNIVPLDDGDVVDLGGVVLEIIDVPGHSPGHIALYDCVTSNIFLGDSIADRIDPTMFLPCHSPPWFDREEFYRTLDKLRTVDFDTVCLAHYGCWDGVDAATMLDDARQVFEKFWAFFEANRDRLDDTGYLARSLIEKYSPWGDPAMAKVGALIMAELREGFREYHRLRGRP